MAKTTNIYVRLEPGLLAAARSGALVNSEFGGS